jgi:hypothetical protein
MLSNIRICGEPSQVFSWNSPLEIRVNHEIISTPGKLAEAVADSSRNINLKRDRYISFLGLSVCSSQ